MSASDLLVALRAIIALEPVPYAFPGDWQEQIKACAECERWKGHPIQAGICNEHRKPLWARERWDDNEEKRLIYRAQDIAKAAIAKAEGR